MSIEVCRLCLKYGFGYINLAEGIMDKNTKSTCLEMKTIFLKLKYCIDIQVSLSDNLSKHICLDCVHNLDSFYTFKRMCKNSEEVQRTALQNPFDLSNEPMEERVITMNDTSTKNITQSTLKITDESSSRSSISIEREISSRPRTSVRSNSTGSTTIGDNSKKSMEINNEKSNTSTYGCSICSKQLKNLTALKSHSRSHGRKSIVAQENNIKKSSENVADLANELSTSEVRIESTKSFPAPDEILCKKKEISRISEIFTEDSEISEQSTQSKQAGEDKRATKSKSIADPEISALKSTQSKQTGEQNKETKSVNLVSLDNSVPNEKGYASDEESLLDPPVINTNCSVVLTPLKEKLFQIFLNKRNRYLKRKHESKEGTNVEERNEETMQITKRPCIDLSPPKLVAEGRAGTRRGSPTNLSKNEEDHHNPPELNESNYCNLLNDYTHQLLTKNNSSDSEAIDDADDLSYSPHKKKAYFQIDQPRKVRLSKDGCEMLNETVMTLRRPSRSSKDCEEISHFDIESSEASSKISCNQTSTTNVTSTEDMGKSNDLLAKRYIIYKVSASNRSKLNEYEENLHPKLVIESDTDCLNVHRNQESQIVDQKRNEIIIPEENTFCKQMRSKLDKESITWLTSIHKEILLTTCSNSTDLTEKIERPSHRKIASANKYSVEHPIDEILNCDRSTTTIRPIIRVKTPSELGVTFAKMNNSLLNDHTYFF